MIIIKRKFLRPFTPAPGYTTASDRKGPNIRIVGIDSYEGVYQCLN